MQIVLGAYQLNKGIMNKETIIFRWNLYHPMSFNVLPRLGYTIKVSVKTVEILHR
jgi:hypothetical protein